MLFLFEIFALWQAANANIAACETLQLRRNLILDFSINKTTENLNAYFDLLTTKIAFNLLPESEHRIRIYLKNSAYVHNTKAILWIVRYNT